MKINKKLKTPINIIIAITMFIITISAASAAETFTEIDYFNRANSNTVGNGWSEANEDTASDLRIENNRLYHEDTSGTQSPYATKSVTWTDENITVKIEVDQTDHHIIFWPYGSGNIVFAANFNTNGWFRTNNGAGWGSDLFAYSTGTNYTIKFYNINMSADTYRIMVNNVTYGGEIDFWTASSTIDTMRLEGGSSTTGMAYFDFLAFTEGSPDPTTPATPNNDSTESTTIVKQIGSVSFTNSMTTIVSSSFNVSVNNTPLYNGFTFQVESNNANTMFCELLVDSIVVGNVTRTNTAGEQGTVKVMSDIDLLLNTTEHTEELRCQRSSGVGLITVSNTVGVGHALVDQDNKLLPYNSSSFSKSITGSSLQLIDSFNFTVGNKSNNATDFNSMIIEGMVTYQNDAGADKVFSTQISTKRSNESTWVNCTTYPRFVSSGGTGSVGIDCFVENVTTNATYEVRILGNGSATYEGNWIAKGFWLGENEVVGGTGVVTGLSFSGDSNQALFSAPGGNENHDTSNVFAELSYSMLTNESTTITFWLEVKNGSSYNTTNFTRDFAAGEIGVIIGQDIIENLPRDDYNTTLWANCGSPTASCTIKGGQSGGYLTDVITTVFNSFNVTAYDSWDNSSINSFVVVNGGTYNTTTGQVQVFTNEDYLNITISSNNYFDKTYLNYNTSNNLNTSLNQSIVRFRGFALITGTELTNINYTLSDGSISKTIVGSNVSIGLKSGNYNVTTSKAGYFDRTISFSISALENKTINVTNIYNTIINFTAKTAIFNTTINNFSVTTPEYGTLNSTNGYIEMPTIQNYNQTYTATSNNKTSSSGTINTNQTILNYTIILYEFNSVYFTFLDENTGEIINTTSITLDIINDIYSVQYNTTNGTIYATILQPLSYVSLITANGYYDRSYYFTVTNDSTQNITIYLLNNTLANNITVNIIDERGIVVEGAIIKALKLDPSDGEYKTVDISQTNFEGKTIMSLYKNTVFYKFIIEYAGSVVRIVPPTTIISNEITFQIVISGDPTSNYDAYKSLTGSWTDNGAGTITLTYNNAQGTNVEICQNIYEITYQGSRSLITTLCDTGSAGVITQTITLQNATTYIATGTYQDAIFTDYDFNTGNDPYEYPVEIQAMISILILLGFLFWKPEWVFFGVSTSLFFGGLIKLHPISSTYTIPLIITGLIIVWLVNRR